MNARHNSDDEFDDADLADISDPRAEPTRRSCGRTSLRRRKQLKVLRILAMAEKRDTDGVLSGCHRSYGVSSLFVGRAHDRVARCFRGVVVGWSWLWWFVTETMLGTGFTSKRILPPTSTIGKMMMIYSLRMWRRGPYRPMWPCRLRRVRYLSLRGRHGFRRVGALAKYRDQETCPN